MIPRRLLILARRVKGKVLASALAILLVSLSYLATAFTTAFALGALARGRTDDAMFWIALTAGTVVLRALAIPLRTAITTASGLAVRRILRADLLAHAMALGPSWASGSRLGEVQATIVEGVDGLDPYYSDYLPQLLITAVLPASIVAGMTFVHGPSAAFLGACLLVTLVVPRIKDAALLRQGSERWRTYLELSSDYMESMQGIPTLRTFGAAERRRDALEARSDSVYAATMRPLRTSLLENGITVGFTLLGTAGAVLLATIAVTDGRREPLAALLVLLLSIECFRPVRDLSKAWHSGYLGLTASGGVDTILGATPDVPDSGTHQLTLTTPPDLQVSQVSYTYPGADRPALREVSLTLPAGGLIAVVGPSGAGKSTFASLLSRRLDPDRGSITIDDIDLRTVSLESLRENMAIVPQHTHLFHDTVAANVRLGAPDATDQQVWDALRDANAAAFVEDLPEGLSTVLAEDGDSLSGGQRQRLALARALVRRTPVLLLDEPTSNVDREADVQIMDALARLRGQHTVIVVAHRLDSIMHADTVIVLANGRAVEHGPPATLAGRDGLFAALRADEQDREPTAERLGEAPNHVR